MTRAALYLRISRDKTGQQAGIERQRADCQALAEARGWTVAAVYADNDVSAYSRKPRPQFERLMVDIAAGEVDAVIAWATDRLYRRNADLDRLVDGLERKDSKGRREFVEVATVKSGDVDLSTADGRVRARLLASIATHESEKKGERVKAAAEQRARAGGFSGGTRRFGYTDRNEALVPKEADAIRWAYDFILRGGSVKGAAKEWRRRGLVGAKGAALTDVAVRDVLLRPINAGIAEYKGEEVGRTQCPTIVDQETFRAVRALLNDPRRRKPGRPGTVLLTGLCRCEVCGGPMSGASRGRTDTPRHTLTYKCRQRHVSRARHQLDELISELVVQRLEADPEGFAVLPQIPVATGPVIEAEKMRGRLDALAQLFAAGELEAADYAAATREARARLTELETRVASASLTPAVGKLVKAGDVRKAWEAYTVDERRAVIREVIDSITVGPGTTGVFTPKNIKVAWKSHDA